MLHHYDLASRLLDECEDVLHGLPPTKWRALCLIRQADLAKNNGRVPAALPLYDEALALARAYGHLYGVMLGGGNRAELLFDLGRSREAIEEFRRLRSELPLGVRVPVIAPMTWHLVLADESSEALDAIREIVTGFPVTGLRGPLGRAIESLALLRARAGDAAGAARLLGCWAAARRSIRRHRRSARGT
jgi:ATP/maltotriose-dependent transcriptional regulator MalT